MNDADRGTSAYATAAVRDGVSARPTGAVQEEVLAAGRLLPLVIRPAAGSFDPLDWARNNRDYIAARLSEPGAILFRDFGIDSAESFRQFTTAIAGELLEYKERSSPRHEMGDRIYTSTDYPPQYRIFLHNEHSYARSFPLKLFFCCVIAAEQGGQTPLADTRKILVRIDPAIRQRFDKGWMYVRNFGSGFGLTWQMAFQTDDPKQVEEYCRSNDIEWEWRPGGRLRTHQVRPAVATHPRTGATVWFNHATFFHVSTLPPVIRDSFRSRFAEEDLPNNTFYASGAAIEPETMDALRAAYEAETVRFDWRKGDVVLVDNMLVAHGREAFKGPRQVLAAMAEPHERTAG